MRRYFILLMLVRVLRAAFPGLTLMEGRDIVERLLGDLSGDAAAMRAAYGVGLLVKGRERILAAHAKQVSMMVEEPYLPPDARREVERHIEYLFDLLHIIEEYDLE